MSFYHFKSFYLKYSLFYKVQLIIHPIFLQIPYVQIAIPSRVDLNPFCIIFNYLLSYSITRTPVKCNIIKMQLTFNYVGNKYYRQLSIHSFFCEYRSSLEKG